MLNKQRDSLETQIRDCEARLKAHDTRLSYSMHLLKEEATATLTSKGVMIGAGAVGTVLGLLWARRKRQERHDALFGWDEDAQIRRHRRRMKKARKLSFPELLQRWGPLLLPMLSPMLNPKLAASMAKFGLPVALKQQESLPTVPQLDLKRYAGTWYEVARLPTRHEKQCASDVSAEYEVSGSGDVVVRNRCRKADGTLEEVEGGARVPDPVHPGQLEVTFAPAALRWFPAVWADYYVLFVDEDYQVALVGTPDRENLWILARQPQVPAADLEALRALALRHGFDTSRLVSVPHQGEVQDATAGPVLSTVQAGAGAAASAG